MGEAIEREAAQVAHDEQQVGVDRVGMEQVVLHPADDPAEGRYVAAKHAVEVHAPECPSDALRLAEDLEEQAVMPRVLPEFLVDEPEAVLQAADSRGPHAAERRVLAQELEELEDRRGRAHEHVVTGRLERVGDDVEARVQRPWRRRRGAQDRLAEQLEQHFVEQRNVHHRPVVALHQLLDGQRVARVLVAELAGEPDLVVEQQAVLAPLVGDMQREADLPQERARGLELLQFGQSKEAVRDEAVERFGAEVALRDPGDGLDVAQAAGACLDVRLEVVGGVVVARVAVGLFAHLRLVELGGAPDVVGRQCGSHGLEQRLRAVQQARLHERGRDTDVGQALLLAVIDGAHAVADLEADVPEEGQEPAEHLVPFLRITLRKEDHHVDVGAGVQLAASVAADGDQREFTGADPRMQVPGAYQHGVDQAGAVEDERVDRLVGLEAPPQVEVAVADGGAEFRRRIARQRRETGGQHREVRPRGGGRGVGDGADRLHAAVQGSSRPFWPRVSTSQPVAVTSTVCSHCADSE